MALPYSLLDKMCLIIEFIIIIMVENIGCEDKKR